MVGLAECVNHFINSTEQEKRFGWSKTADDMGEDIVPR